MGASSAWDHRRPPDPALLRDCVHCGFCLPSCPTYALWASEPDSPRGRIELMRLGHEQPELSGEMVTHFDRCLGCMACVTACPSGVRYDLLLQQTRAQVERLHPRSRADRAYRAALFGLFTHPGRLRAVAPAAAAAGRLGMGTAAMRRRGGLLGRVPRLRALLALTPRAPARAALHRLAERTPALGPARGRVGLVQGCVQRAFFGDVNAATVRVLSAEGFEVLAPRLPRCCGSLQLHSGSEREARALAKATIDAFDGCETVVSNAAGCGSGMKDYGDLLADEPEWARRARDFSARVRDVHEHLAAAGTRAPRGPLPMRAVYHDACHLAHAQGVRAQPRRLLGEVPGLELVEPGEWEICCGSAGVHNLLEPGPARELGARKARNLLATGAETIVSANPGCSVQIAAHLRAAGHPPAIVHPMELLDRSVRAGASRGQPRDSSASAVRA